MAKERYANAVAFAGIALTATGIMRTAEGLSFWILLGSAFMLMAAAILEAFFIED